MIEHQQRRSTSTSIGDQQLLSLSRVARSWLIKWASQRTLPIFVSIGRSLPLWSESVEQLLVAAKVGANAILLFATVQNATDAPEKEKHPWALHSKVESVLHYWSQTMQKLASFEWQPWRGDNLIDVLMKTGLVLLPAMFPNRASRVDEFEIRKKNTCTCITSCRSICPRHFNGVTSLLDEAISIPLPDGAAEFTTTRTFFDFGSIECDFGLWSLAWDIHCTVNGAKLHTAELLFLSWGSCKVVSSPHVPSIYIIQGMRAEKSVQTRPQLPPWWPESRHDELGWVGYKYN